MTMNIQDLLALANQAAAVGPDMTEVKSGGASKAFSLGTAFATLVGYIEFGNHAQEFNGKPKAPALEVQLLWALTGTAMDGTKYCNDDGSPYIYRQYSFSISQNEKAKAHLLFKKLNWKGTATHFAQLLGNSYLIPMAEEAKSKAEPLVKVVRPQFAGVLPPRDMITGAEYPVPPVARELYRLFLWDFPTVEGWNSLHIEGKNDNGESKNFVQQKLVSALNFEGSALQSMLLTANLPIPEKLKPKAAAAAPAVPPAVPAIPAAAPVAPPAAPAAAPGVAVPAAPFVPPASAVAAPAATPAPATPASPSATPAGSTTTSPSSVPALPSMPPLVG